MIKKLLITISITLGLLFTTNVNSAEYGPIAEKETLWTIASRNRPSYNVTTQQMMLAIRRTNPDAFQAKNINALKVGAILQLPSLEEIRKINRSYALHAAKEQNKYWKSKQQTPLQQAKVTSSKKNKHRAKKVRSSSSRYKRYYKASQRELRKIQKQLRREKRKTRKLKEELAKIKSANSSNSSQPKSGKAGNIIALQEELKLLEKTIKEKNMHIAQLENMKAIAGETIKKQAATNEALFNKLKAIAPEQVINLEAKSGSLQLQGVDEPILSTPNGGTNLTQTSKVATSASDTETGKNTGFIIVLSVLSLLFALSLLWRLYAQKIATKNAQTQEHSKAEELHNDDVIEDNKDLSMRRDPLLNT